jgi:hypothetical protein
MLGTEHLDCSSSVESLAAPIAVFAESYPAFHYALVYGVKGFHEVKKSSHTYGVCLVLAHRSSAGGAESSHEASIYSWATTETNRVIFLQCIRSKMKLVVEVSSDPRTFRSFTSL